MHLLDRYLTRGLFYDFMWLVQDNLKSGLVEAGIIINKGGVFFSELFYILSCGNRHGVY